MPIDETRSELRALPRIAVGIADDHPIVRHAVRQLVSGQPDMHVVGEASDRRSANDLLRSTPPDVLVMELGMQGHSGLDVLATLRKRMSGVAVLVFTGYPANLYAVNVLREGAKGFLNKDHAPERLLDAVRTVAAGQRYLTPEVSELLAGRLRGMAPSAYESLTRREFQVFLKLAGGSRPVAIADTLALSVKTISACRTRLMAKLALSSDSELTHFALQHGLRD